MAGCVSRASAMRSRVKRARSSAVSSARRNSLIATLWRTAPSLRSPQNTTDDPPWPNTRVRT